MSTAVSTEVIDVEVTETSWRPRGELTFEQWVDAGATLQKLARSVQWLLGDWLAYGEKRYGETYAQAIDLTGLEYQTVADAAWVASKVELSRRRESLSWSHHKEIAALEPADQDEWLDRAEAEGMTRDRLRCALRAARSTAAEAAEPDQPQMTHAVRLTIRVAAATDAQAHERADELVALVERKGWSVTHKQVKAL
ncbi:MAG: LmbU family transcriptional regulator [Chloroflexi bacterium]|nr:LmbU family transcriptional regulator [Chloroflexota bacterium]